MAPTCWTGPHDPEASPAVEIEVGGRSVRVSDPDRVCFPEIGATRRDLVDCYPAVGDGIVRARRDRPGMVHRYPDGLAGEKVHQKALPEGAPDRVETVPVWFPRFRRTVRELLDELSITGRP
ncbi:hypothetical protein [Arsenicicoccus dermatophilus]|uniref:non-homologous end-joining DNA ligase LigD n=1 Tax=Arsenicicoccus dermatophilus TaxID=1076331 RepID=UPI001F4CC63A|nr:hypothetical protein [Arsenicicoccus dermatophilus]MCH8614156.1 hypothetical protein [Arsenicicoccus dermatophilus]